MAKKQSIGLLINNPLNTIQPPRNPSQYGGASAMNKPDNIPNPLRHQSMESKQAYSMGASQFNSNKLMARQPGSQPQIQQNLTNIGMQKS